MLRRLPSGIETKQHTESGDVPKVIAKRLGPVFMYDSKKASKYQEFHVVKIKKLAQRQERILGIDDKTIVNLAPDTRTKIEKTKRPERQLIEVVKVWLVAARANVFAIEFTDGRAYRYESTQAEEIVAKLNYLLKMRDEKKSM